MAVNKSSLRREPVHSILIKRIRAGQFILVVSMSLMLTVPVATGLACGGACLCSLRSSPKPIARPISHLSHSSMSALQHNRMSCHGAVVKGSVTDHPTSIGTDGQCQCSGLRCQDKVPPIKNDGTVVHPGFEGVGLSYDVPAFLQDTQRVTAACDPPVLGLNLIYRYHQLRR